MKKMLFATVLLLIILMKPSITFAQNVMGNWTGSPSSSIDQTAIREQQAEEQEGQNLLDQLKNKTTTCQKLTDDNFEKIGEYFMGQAIGDTSRHIQMNAMMQSMMGKQGEEQMHIAWGKRGSGCDTSSQFSPNGTGLFAPMMWMMGGGGNPMMGYGGWNNMMGGWNGFGLLGWIPMLLFWVLLFLGAVALIRYLGRSGQQQDNNTPLEILKERYARGEIDKKEYEDKKKDLS
ncbi:MAG: hypothetical protein UX85_C0009G0011 [Candidatus Beckwithbacteria bacterium GW2011_GWB1_47_15]|uniref:SHOCT domain-containing protein n=1 Tax=Candidatus Beckwithbacteria bacterium GW2011_GWB1_47_15 TaxID=1618371 RepID=A0A0G1U2G9_9BACT|nr:MAG: hypothetical protein UW18_C0003G0011 [Microgenomates group bacterium GW2011_GWF1_44_10]KKU02448.1 MAG: hypothetical protein UX04_C0001G0219 [Microgenomates group bacterium GW2011_GWF2_45_18]KKU60558.1 MAG: hypothetical protein UX85_C0009G0011 [Candidatus Beckwithbacteria bacterium GW2011_GWB1_47_15]KKU71328.1 MAG: hypothetical protein UX97_C0008G0011 [Candidatus Beckwithbacteria bacterium GW2011_GWA2_47_25]HAU99085.1 hypothetical protein [Candidatus Paceibacterota bacterium]